ncbi:hypothetical protein [Lentzea sp. NPDC055074]
MHNELTGRVSGASLQIGEVHGDVVVDVGTATPAPDRGRAPSKARKPSNARFAVVYFTAGVLFIVIFTAVSTSWGGRAPQAESHGIPRPAGVDDNAPIQVTVNKLDQCTAAVAAAPVNCPQAVSVRSPRNLDWWLANDPGDDISVKWSGGRFLVRGTAVMVADFDRGTIPDRIVDAFYFEAEVHWRGAKAEIGVIRRLRSAPESGQVTKQRYDLPDSDLDRVTRAGFATCTAATSSPMPRTCPRTSFTPSVPKVAWTLDGDPVANVSRHRDAEFGLLRVRGDYSADAQWTTTFPWTMQHSYPQSGNYEATIVRNPNGTPQLLAIKELP